jgi:hypothetical protein
MSYKTWAPMCSMPHCTNRVQYHKRYQKEDNTWGYKWKQMCEHHRNEGKVEADMYKIDKGCANKDGRYGFYCTANILSPEQLYIHHKDGNRNNDDATNLEVLCGNCHSYITIKAGHHLTRYKTGVTLNPKLFDF